MVSIFSSHPVTVTEVVTEAVAVAMAATETVVIEQWQW